MTINIFSDIHLSTRQDRVEYPIGFSINNIKPADVILIPGDFGYTRDGFVKALEDLKQFAVANNCRLLYCKGNHDYYFDRDEIHELTSEIPYAGTTKIIDNTAFILTTGWTPIDKNWLECQYGMNDYRAIDNYRISTNNKVSIVQWNFIFDSVKRFSDDSEIKNIVIATHHVPLEKLISPQFVGSPLNEAFCMMDSEIQARIYDEICNNPKVKLWAHGHSHDFIDKTIGNVHFVRNPIGYNSERVHLPDDRKFNINYVVEI